MFHNLLLFNCNIQFFLYIRRINGYLPCLPVKTQIDPRIRILFVSLLSVTVFIVDQLPVAAGLVLSFAVLRMVFKAPFRSVKTFLTLSMLVIFIVLLQTLFGPGENYIVKPLFPASVPIIGGKGSLKWEGFILGLMIGCRLAALVILLPLLTAAPPGQIAQGLTSLGFNYRAAFTITSAFNLIPLFEDEARAIMDAQKLRGRRSFEEGSFLSKLKAYPSLVIPLVLGAMRKAQAAGIAMDARAFGAYKTRTWTEKQAMKAKDYLLLVIFLVFVILVLVLNFTLKKD
jgi:energy-coupling factor transport system permease protein